MLLSNDIKIDLNCQEFVSIMYETNEENTKTVLMMTSKQATDKVWGAFYSLTEREQDMIADSIGFCPKCRKTFKSAKDKDGDDVYVRIKPMPYTVLAEKYQFSDPNTAKKHLKEAYAKMREYIEKTEYFGVMEDGMD